MYNMILLTIGPILYSNHSYLLEAGSRVFHDGPVGPHASKARHWFHKIFSWKYLTMWRPVLPDFPRTQIASFLISTLNSFQGKLMISSAVAHTLILVEVDGKCQFVGNSSHFYLSFIIACFSGMDDCLSFNNFFQLLGEVEKSCFLGCWVFYQIFCPCWAISGCFQG